MFPAESLSGSVASGEASPFKDKVVYYIDRFSPEEELSSFLDWWIRHVRIGQPFEWILEGDDPPAARLARRLYGALTSPYAFQMNFDTFDTPESSQEAVP